MYRISIKCDAAGDFNMGIIKKQPLRRCCGCNSEKTKKEMLRIVRSPEDVVSVDLKGKLSGRGAYICYDVECLKKALKTKRLERSLKTSFTPEIYEALTSEVEKAKTGQDNV